MLKRVTPDDTSGAMVRLGDVKTAAPFVSGLEYGAPARGVWNIVHIGMLIPGAHQIYVCAGNCLRGVVLTAAEMNAQSRFSTITIKENNVLDGVLFWRNTPHLLQVRLIFRFFKICCTLT